MNLRSSPLALAAGLTLSALCAAATAQAPDATSSSEAPAATPEPMPHANASSRPLWELGLVSVAASQTAWPGAQQRVGRFLVLPYVVYRGEHLRADRDSAGWRAYKTSGFELDLGVGGSLGGAATNEGVRQGMPQLGTLLELGPRASWTLTQHRDEQVVLELPLRAALDLSHRGRHRGWTLEPKLRWERALAGNTFVAVSTSAVLADQRLASYFYGVEPPYATTQRPAYQARAGLVAWRLSASGAWRIHPQWRVFGALRGEVLSGAVNLDSPLVQRKTGYAAALGLVYTWKQSEQRGAD
ncbi:MipA/OmpV family protein [Roseateles sp. BYS180W]|uniref:MipA/OmpV family protein n=1 Tax=Roseateles rivi TaxID=3299028 RepID=A0ABW7FY88_9BURK